MYEGKRMCVSDNKRRFRFTRLRSGGWHISAYSEQTLYVGMHDDNEGAVSVVLYYSATINVIPARVNATPIMSIGVMRS